MQYEHTSNAVSVDDGRFGRLKVFSVITLMGVSLPVLGIVFQTFMTFAREPHNSHLPWTFHTIWEVAFLVLASSVSARFGMPKTNFFAFMIGVGFVSLVVDAVVGFFVPDSFYVFRPQYFGVESRRTLDMDDYETTGFYDSTSSVMVDPLVKGALFHNEDPEIAPTLDELAKDNAYADLRGFLLWQTGMAKGYDPTQLENYNGGDGILSRVELFFTVGPLTIVESVLWGLVRHLPAFMVYFIVLYAKDGIWAWEGL